MPPENRQPIDTFIATGLSAPDVFREPPTAEMLQRIAQLLVPTSDPAEGPSGHVTRLCKRA